jgi:hypothetical protein
MTYIASLVEMDNNNDKYFEDDPNENHEFDFENDMANVGLSQFMYGDFNAIPNSTVIAENLVIALAHVVPNLFCHKDLTTFHARMKDFHDVPHVNSILQHFKLHLLNSICI